MCVQMPVYIQYPHIPCCQTEGHQAPIGKQHHQHTPPFVVTDTNDESALGLSLDFSTLCPYFEEADECQLGLKHRFLGTHACVDDSGAVMLIIDEDKKSGITPSNAELNQISAEILKLFCQNKVSS